jgi:hypothetical protein
MLYLVELSVPLTLVRNAALMIDPVTAADLSYALKTWLSTQAGLAMRPWNAFPAGQSVRLVGWRREAPQASTLTSKIYLSHRKFECRDGDNISLLGTVVPLRRTSRNGTIRLSRDAADGYKDQNIAYEAWLRERLIDIIPYFELHDFSIVSYAKRRVLRKFGLQSRQIVREQVVPVVTAQIGGSVIDHVVLEDWLVRGVGPQKAFGFGAFLPC